MAKTKKEPLPIVKFISEEDRKKFCELFMAELKSNEVDAELKKRGPKNRSFKVKRTIDGFRALGIDPNVEFFFKKVRGADEYDLNIELKNLTGAFIEEYFDEIKPA